jgi:hypothetical protein
MKSYQFSTLQELVDRVPADRIPLCMEELGRCFGLAKSSTILLYEAARVLAEKDGVKVPDCPERVIEMPPVITWDDDGKGEIAATMQHPDGGEFFTVALKAKP